MICATCGEKPDNHCEQCHVEVESTHCNTCHMDHNQDMRHCETCHTPTMQFFADDQNRKRYRCSEHMPSEEET